MKEILKAVGIQISDYSKFRNNDNAIDYIQLLKYYL